MKANVYDLKQRVANLEHDAEQRAAELAQLRVEVDNLTKRRVEEPTAIYDDPDVFDADFETEEEKTAATYDAILFTLEQKPVHTSGYVGYGRTALDAAEQ